MREVTSETIRKKQMEIGVGALLLVGGMVFALPLASQHQGPLPPPPQRADVPASAPAAVPAMTSARRREASSRITDEPPAMPVEQIIQKFAQREEEFRKERDNFTYTQMFVIQTIDMDGQPDGEHRMTSDILLDRKSTRLNSSHT